MVEENKTNTYKKEITTTVEKIIKNNKNTYRDEIIAIIMFIIIVAITIFAVNVFVMEICYWVLYGNFFNILDFNLLITRLTFGVSLAIFITYFFFDYSS